MGSGRQSDPSGGVSAFRAGASMDGTQDHGVPTEKFVVGSNDTASEIMNSKEYQNNDDLQQMYDRIVGAPSNGGKSNNDMGRQSDFLKEQHAR